ncbi:MAG TPA: GNAT family protein [Thiobacillaceae bacterium]|nr:GNAT family protein [Thiobacillaceae bacterium]
MALVFPNKFPVLSTDRLVLRQLTPEDRDAMFAIFSDREVTADYFDLPTLTDAGQAARLIGRLREGFAKKQSLRWGITLKPENRVVGTVGFNYVMPPTLRGGVGFDLAHAYWGRGLMREALPAVIEYGFRTMGLNRIEALVVPANAASAGLLRRLGFRDEGTLRDYGFWKDRFWDLTCFSLLRTDPSPAAPHRSGPDGGQTG